MASSEKKAGSGRSARGTARKCARGFSVGATSTNFDFIHH